MKKLLLLLIATISLASCCGCTAGPSGESSSSSSSSASLPLIDDTAQAAPRESAVKIDMGQAYDFFYTRLHIAGMDYVFVENNNFFRVINLTNDSIQNLLLTKQLR